MEKLRKARIDAVLIQGFSENARCNTGYGNTWELEGISPSSRKLRRVEMMLANLRSSQNEDRASFRIQ